MKTKKKKKEFLLISYLCTMHPANFFKAKFISLMSFLWSCELQSDF